MLVKAKRFIYCRTLVLMNWKEKNGIRDIWNEYKLEQLWLKLVPKESYSVLDSLLGKEIWRVAVRNEFNEIVPVLLFKQPIEVDDLNFYSLKVYLLLLLIGMQPNHKYLPYHQGSVTAQKLHPVFWPPSE